ncbi:MAG TPA: AzlD domain-containing protein [Holophaga sp.]|nr:AzlD domain-containing protein [Holophaga sp.]
MRSPWQLLALMTGCGLLTFLLRFSFIGGGRRLASVSRFQHLLRYVPFAVLSAIIAPEILIRHGAFDPSPANPRLWAGAVAILVAFLTRNVLATIAAGMSVLWLIQRFF